MKVRYGRYAKRRGYNELHIGRVNEYFYHAAQQCTRAGCDHFFGNAMATEAILCLLGR